LEIDRRTVRLIVVAFLLLAGLTTHRLFFAEAPFEGDVLVLQGETMGTTWEIRVAGDGLGEGLRREIAAETDRRLAAVDTWLSNWNPESEISRFNAHTAHEPFRVSYETADVVAYAIEVAKMSGGAFDITVGPLVALWGFGADARVGTPPSEEEIANRLRYVGIRYVHVARGHPEAGGFLAKDAPETRVDVSAIAKGYGVDQVAVGLYSLGREDFLVEIGGEIRASGERPGGGPWRVAIEKPVEEGRAIHEVVELSDLAMATSGDYRIFYRLNDQRIAHTIDPRTGRPVRNGVASATVVAPTATIADAWATALMVLGPDPGLEIADHLGLGAMLLVRDAEGGFESHANDLFPGPAPAADPAAPLAETGEPNAQALALGQATVAPFKKALKAALQRGMASGPEKALQTCRLEAPRIAQASAAPDVELGRTSHRLRNPANAPRPWVEPLLARYASGEAPIAAQVVSISEGRIGYVEPIRAEALCLTCHGERLPPPVATEIARLYPEDQATGFAEGDFRGVFWAEMDAP
jgi:thiamine biosynthesis lipoprotein